jgi:hypothetical protein
MNLRTLFAIPIAVILIVTLSLAGMVAGQGWTSLIRGRAAIEAVERMRLLLALQTDLRAERIVTNFVNGQPYPLAEPQRQRFQGARRETDHALRAVIDDLRDEAEGRTDGASAEEYAHTVVARLQEARAITDKLLTHRLSERTLTELDSVMPHLLEVSRLVDGPLERASVAVTAADPALSGLMTEDRLTESLRDQVGLIAAVLLPRFDKAEQPSFAELDRVRILLARAAYLTRLLNDTNEIAGTSESIRLSLTRV